MSRRRFFIDAPLVADSTLDIDAPLAHYARDVLRLAAGDSLQVFNGDGLDYTATVLALHRRGMQIALGDARAGTAESPLAIELGLGLARGERMDWALQKATELGAARITPLALERCTAKFESERADNRMRHWRQVISSACEQCGRSRLPQLDLPQEAGAWLAEEGEALRLVMHPATASPLAQAAAPRRIRVLIGPEGGLSDAEVQRARDAGFLPWSVGPRVLRAETAPAAALAILQYLWGDGGGDGGAT